MRHAALVIPRKSRAFDRPQFLQHFLSSRGYGQLGFAMFEGGPHGSQEAVCKRVGERAQDVVSTLSQPNRSRMRPQRLKQGWQSCLLQCDEALSS